MLYLYTVLLLCCLLLLVAGIVEQRRHFASLEQIPTRVLINGIRGKSSITRLCAGALRGGDLVTVAKTTGTAARFIHPDATEEPVFRKFGLANVAEQIGIVRRAASYRPDALVIECMAVMPALQEINQEKLIRSTIGVLCNVREDHLAEMGPTLDDVARSLSRSMPVGGVCVTAERDRLHILQQEAEARDCRLVAVDPETVTDAELRGFSWFTFKENVAIALAVAELLGVDRATALQGMYDAPPDPGVLSVERYRTDDGKRLRFANVFAANDPESTLMNVQQLESLGAIRRPLNVVINCRPDRVERNGQMGEIVPKLAPDAVFLIGHPTKSARDAIPGDFTGRVVDLGGDRRDPAELTRDMLAELAPSASLVAVGNIHGQGELLLEHLAELALDDEPDEQDAAQHAGAATMPLARPPEPEPYGWVASLESTGEHRTLTARALAAHQAHQAQHGFHPGVDQHGQYQGWTPAAQQPPGHGGTIPTQRQWEHDTAAPAAARPEWPLARHGDTADRTGPYLAPGAPGPYPTHGPAPYPGEGHPSYPADGSLPSSAHGRVPGAEPAFPAAGPAPHPGGHPGWPHAADGPVPYPGGHPGWPHAADGPGYRDDPDGPPPYPDPYQPRNDAR